MGKGLKRPQLGNGIATQQRPLAISSFEPILAVAYSIIYPIKVHINVDFDGINDLRVEWCHP
jgi:hypothetical protein